MMPSFQFEIDEKSEAATRFITSVRDELVKAMLEEKQSRGLSQSDVAALIGISPSVVSRQLSGEANLTLRSVAEIAWALGRQPRFRLEAPSLERGCNASGESRGVASSDAAPRPLDSDGTTYLTGQAVA